MITALLAGICCLALASWLAYLVVFAKVSHTDHRWDGHLAAQPETPTKKFVRGTVGMYRRGEPRTVRAA